MRSDRRSTTRSAMVARVLRGRGHTAKEHVVPGIVVKRCDLETRRQRRSQLCQCLGQTQKDQSR